MKVSRHSNYVLFAGASALALSLAAPIAAAQDGDADDDQPVRTMNTVLVTTQKTEESLQDVPIAVSAFDGEMLENLNINTGQELQFNIPNFQASIGNFTAGSIGVRGIQNAAVAASSDASVGMHINGIPTATTPVLETEFYDTERVEVLRGPQGTLYGRNATGGVVNVVTAKPILEEFAAQTDLTIGDFNTLKFDGFVNIPMGERVAARVAGFAFQRDGFSDATLPDGTTTDVDDRDLYGIRATLAAEFTDKFSGFLMYDYFNEESTRVRSAKQLCTRDTRPFPFNQGCVPYELQGGGSLDYARDANGNPIGVRPGFDSADNSGAFATVVAVGAGLYDLGVDPNGGLPVSTDLRQYDTAVLPIYESERDLIAGELVYDFDNDLTLTVNASYTERFRDSFDNYNKTVAAVPFNIVPGLAPDLDGDGDGDFVGINSSLLGPLAQTTNVNTGIPAPSDRLITNDLSTVDEETTTFEARLQSDFDGMFNFNIGAIKIDSDVTTNYYVFANGLEAALTGTNATFSSIVLPADRSYFQSRSPVTLDALGIFGEGYWDITDDFKVTLGLRYTDDDKSQLVTPTLLLSTEGLPEEQGVYERSAPQQAQFEEITGRFGFDWQTDILPWSDDSLLYAFYSRGYKGGGINPPQASGLGSVDDAFDPEFINAYEIGTKSTILNGAGFLNLTAFYYDYEGYQISNIINRTALNVNVDAEVTGLEVEFFGQLTDSFAINATLGLLDTELGEVVTLDTYDQTGGDPDWVVVKNLGTAQNCIANVADVNTLLTANGGAFAGLAAFICTPDAAQATLGGATLRDTLGALTPEIREGNPVDITGNSLPRAPDTTFSLGGQYQFDVGNWQTTIRGDYYYQSEMFTRIFNLEADRIESWENFNASIAFDNDDLGLRVELYGKNLFEDDQITGQYLSDASTALFTNVFVLDPRQFGVKLSKRW